MSTSAAALETKQNEPKVGEAKSTADSRNQVQLDQAAIQREAYENAVIFDSGGSAMGQHAQHHIIAAQINGQEQKQQQKRLEEERERERARREMQQFIEQEARRLGVSVEEIKSKLAIANDSKDTLTYSKSEIENFLKAEAKQSTSNTVPLQLGEKTETKQNPEGFLTNDTQGGDGLKFAEAAGGIRDTVQSEQANGAQSRAVAGMVGPIPIAALLGAFNPVSALQLTATTVTAAAQDAPERSAVSKENELLREVAEIAKRTATSDFDSKVGKPNYDQFYDELIALAAKRRIDLNNDALLEKLTKRFDEEYHALQNRRLDELNWFEKKFWQAYVWTVDVITTVHDAVESFKSRVTWESIKSGFNKAVDFMTDKGTWVAIGGVVATGALLFFGAPVMLSIGIGVGVMALIGVSQETRAALGQFALTCLNSVKDFFVAAFTNREQFFAMASSLLGAVSGFLKGVCDQIGLTEIAVGLRDILTGNFSGGWKVLSGGFKMLLDAI